MVKLTKRVDHPNCKKTVFIYDDCLFLQNNNVYWGHPNPDIFYGFPNMLKFVCLLLLRAMCSLFTFFLPMDVYQESSCISQKIMRISTRVYMYVLRAGGKISLACQF